MALTSSCKPHTHQTNEFDSKQAAHYIGKGSLLEIIAHHALPVGRKEALVGGVGLLLVALGLLFAGLAVRVAVLGVALNGNRMSGNSTISACGGH